MKLNDEQIAILNDLRDANEQVDGAIANITARYERDVYYAKAPLRERVPKAIAAGIPKRQIATQALNKADQRVLEQYLPTDPKHFEVPQAEAPVIEYPDREVKSRKYNDDVLIVTDERGQDWEFWIQDFDGQLLPERSTFSENSAATHIATPVSVIIFLEGEGYDTTLLKEDV